MNTNSKKVRFSTVAINMFRYLERKTEKVVNIVDNSELFRNNRYSQAINIVVPDVHKDTNSHVSLALHISGDKIVNYTGSIFWCPVASQDVLHIEIPTENENICVAWVDQNNIFLASDVFPDEIICYICQKALNLLNFDSVNVRAAAQVRGLLGNYEAYIMGYLKALISDTKLQCSARQSEITLFKAQLYTAANEHRTAEQLLDKLTHYHHVPAFCHEQGKVFQNLLANKAYSSIVFNEDNIQAVTSAITLEDVDVGCFLVTLKIDGSGGVSIEAYENNVNELNEDGYFHPHVDRDGNPCFGNLVATIPLLLGSGRFGEALSLIYDFLKSYNSDSPYLKLHELIGEVDSCEDCSDFGTPYCIRECPRGSPNSSCQDCSEYRTNYCFTTCEYNADWDFQAPYDDCNEKCSECPYKELCIANGHISEEEATEQENCNDEEEKE